VIVSVRVSISLAKSALDGSAMVDVNDAAEDGEGGGLWSGAVDCVVVAAAAEGVVAEVEDGRDRDTRLSRTSGPRVAGPWLRSS
jgi:hypothetical protein